MGVHEAHCYIGENFGGCKYGDDNCPARKLLKLYELTFTYVGYKERGVLWFEAIRVKDIEEAFYEDYCRSSHKIYSIREKQNE